MKKILTTILLVGFVLVCTSQETKFSFTSGYVNANAKLKFKDIVMIDDVADPNFNEINNTTLTESQSGFFAGISAEIGFSESIYLNPKLLYTNVDDLSLLQVPVFVMYKVNNNFGLLAGPQFTYTLEKVFSEVRKLNVGIGAGVAYDISEKLFIDANYTLQLNDYYKDKEIISKLNFFNIGLGYRFN